MRRSIGISTSMSASCPRESSLLRNTLPLTHQPGTENRLKSNTLSITEAGPGQGPPQPGLRVTLAMLERRVQGAVERWMLGHENDRAPPRRKGRPHVVQRRAFVG